MRKKKYSKLVGVLLSDETHALLVDVTDKAEISLSEYVRAIIEDKIKKIQEEGE